MNDIRGRLIEQYELRKDSELISLYRKGGLTDVANDTLRQVLLDRGIDPDSPDSRKPSNDGDAFIPAPVDSKGKSDSKQPEGLGGCLILIAIGLPATLVLGIYILGTDYLPLFTNGIWEN